MTYICVDRGTDKCPCHLMESGQCYTCGMTQRDRCDCQAGWQGVCPYTEYNQRRKSPVEAGKAKSFMVWARRDFSPQLSVIRLRVPAGFAQKCQTLGAFIMVEVSCGENSRWRVPLSVMKATAGTESSLDLAVYCAGPKTIELLKSTSVGGLWQVYGPYYNGIINSERFDSKKLTIAVAKGMAVMPLINMKEHLGGSLISLYIDKTKLPDEWVDKYLGGLEYEEVNLEEDLDELCQKLTQDFSYCIKCAGMVPNIMIMTSPYFFQRLIKNTGLSEDMAIRPNHANMCCGEGLCGACSHTDKEGLTARGCKCN